MKIKKIIRRIIIAFTGIAVLAVACVLGIDGYVKGSVKKLIVSPEDAAQLKDIDCILVLGCAVRANGNPSAMLSDRLDTALTVYESGASDKLLMSGDHGSDDYDEVGVMKQYAIDRGVQSDHIFMDHAGFSTYESLYRAKEIFETKRVLIITQKYHLYRALYVAKGLGIDAWGVSADQRTYSKQQYRELREILARVKDFGFVLFKPEPTYLGEVIPVNGNGDLTN